MADNQNSYLLGSPVEITMRFKVHNALTDPTTIILTVKKPDKSCLEYTYPADDEIVRESVGIFKAVITGDLVGEWNYRVKGTGTAGGVDEESFCITESAVID